MMASAIDTFIEQTQAWLPRTQLRALAVLNAMSHEIRPDGKTFVHHPNDPGGATNFGISLRFLAASASGDTDGDGFADGDFDRDGDVDADDIRGLTYNQAAALYVKHFWKPHGIDQLPPRLANKVFDMAINMGPKQAIKILQYSLQTYRPFAAEPLTIDGAIGAVTLAAASAWVEPNRLNPIMSELRGNTESFYEGLVQQNEDFAVFLNGWKKRAQS